MKTRRLWPFLAAVAFLAAHLAVLPAHVDSGEALAIAGRIDAFPGGTSDELVASPIFLLLGKAGTAIARRTVGGAAESSAIYGLAAWGAIFGALAVWPLLYLFERLSGRRDIAWSATLITLTAPAAWAGAWMPTSHVPGFMLALVAQVLLVGALLEAGDEAGGVAVVIVHRRDDPVFARLVVSGALVTAIALGMRPMTLWLTLPLLVAALAISWRRRARALVGAAVLLSAVALAAWAVPFMVAGRGPGRYWPALVRELWPGPVEGAWLSDADASLTRALLETLVAPWHVTWLGIVVLAVAVAGLLVGPRPTSRGRRALVLAVAPYLVLHLLVHDTRATMLALPLLPVVAYFASLGLAGLGRRALGAGTVALAIGALLVSWSL